jgi:hypothetical protein
MEAHTGDAQATPGSKVAHPVDTEDHLAGMEANPVD